MSPPSRTVNVSTALRVWRAGSVLQLTEFNVVQDETPTPTPSPASPSSRGDVMFVLW